LKRFEKEVEVLRMLQGYSCPHILVPLSIDSNALKIITPFVRYDGTYFLEHIHRRTMTSTTNRLLYFYYCQLVDAVVFLHHYGIEHYDIKLENFLIDPITSRLYLIDFEYSTHTYDVIKAGIGIGTPTYVPPEAYDSALNAQFGKRDVWALGIVFCAMFYNYFPISEKGHKKEFLRLYQKTQYLLPEYIHDCLRLDTATRSNAIDLQSALRTPHSPDPPEQT
jgi:serine/threonine protein kinase